MHSIHSRRAVLSVAAALAFWPSPALSQQGGSVVLLAQRQVKTYLSALADVHCTETVVQEKLAENGEVEASAREQFDYLIMINGHEDDFQLTESRIENPGWHHKLLSTPMLLTNGMATALLIFDPYYRDSFDFKALPEERMDGREVIPVQFAHIPGRRTPAALVLGGREYPLELEGTAWLVEDSGEVMKIDANLLHDMSDIGLHGLTIHVEYKPVQLGANHSEILMPAQAVVDVASARHHWHNTHFFGNYRSFSADAEQAPSVKVHVTQPEETDPSRVVKPALPTDDSKENH